MELLGRILARFSHIIREQKLCKRISPIKNGHLSCQLLPHPCQSVRHTRETRMGVESQTYNTIIVIIVISEFLTSQLWLRNIHLSLDEVIHRIRLDGLICSSKSFLRLNVYQELQIFAFVCMYSGVS